MSLEWLTEIVKAERLDVDLQSSHWEGDVKLLQDCGVYDSKLPNSLAPEKNVRMPPRKKAWAVALRPTVTALFPFLHLSIRRKLC